MYNPQFQAERNSYTDVEERLRMEIHDTIEIGLPDDESNLIQLLEDTYAWIKQAKKVYSIPENWHIKEELE